MALDLVEMPVRSTPQLVKAESLAPADMNAGSESTNLDSLQLETLAINLDAALRVHARPHFFNWTQGVLQSLIKHEVLICALRNGQPLLFRVDSFSTATPNPATLGEMLLRDTTVAPNLIKTWEGRRFRPFTCNTRDEGPFSGGSFAREMERLRATQLFVHGNHDVNGQVTSLFIFACRPETVVPRQEYFVELVVPFLHSAWIRTKLNRAEDGGSKHPTQQNPLTAREQEILRWIYLGKSNFEIGAILKISPLTVKNHVQKILRKLDVVNRTQAVGKALESRILNP